MGNSTKIAGILLIAVIACLSLHAQTPRLFGLTPAGGAPGGYGTIFSIDGDGSNFAVKHTFVTSHPGQRPLGQLVLANDGKFYGTTFQGGAPDQGVLFSYDLATDTYTDLFEFHDTLGAYPANTMIQASDGLLYGTTGGHGLIGVGNGNCIYSFDPVSHAYKVIHSFYDGSTNTDCRISNLMQAPNGKIYAVFGDTILSYNPSTHVYAHEYTFPHNVLTPSTVGALATAPFNNLLYGGGYKTMTQDSAFIYTFDPATDSVKIIAYFHSAGYYVSAGNGMIIMPDTTIYGCYDNYSSSGNTAGGMYSYRLGNYFPSSVNLNGGYGLTMAPNGKIYGTTYYGKIASYNVATHTGTELFGFDSCDRPGVGRMCMGPGGRFYCLSSVGGHSTRGGGFMYSFHPDSIGYTKYFNFNVSTGQSPRSDLTLASNHKLYGVTSVGGYYDYGSIFKYDPSNNSYHIVHEFDTTEWGFTGNYDSYKLTAASNGKLYGVSGGVVYSVDPNTDTYSVVYKPLNVHDSISHFNNTNGFIELPDGRLYGTGWYYINGGYSTIRTFLFSFNPDSLDFQKLASFPTGVNYPSRPTLAKNNRLYFESDSGIYSYDFVTDTILKLYPFIYATTGNRPFGSLYVGVDSMLYGTTGQGASTCGTFFRFNPDFNTFHIVHYFGAGANNYSACAPWATVMQASDGNFYATIEHGGHDLAYCSGGMVYKYDPRTDSLTYIHKFYYDDGFVPQCVLTEVPQCTASTSNISQTICSGNIYTFNSQQLSASGTYTATLTGASSSGCDSMVSLALIVDTITADIVQVSNDSLYVIGNGTIQWLECLTNAPVPNATNNSFVPSTPGSYKAVVTNGNCTDTSACKEAVLIGINNIADVRVTIYPNPSTGNWLLTVSNNLIGAKMEICDQAGHQVYQSLIVGNNTQLQPNVPNGIYLLRITTGSNTQVHKLVKVQ